MTKKFTEIIETATQAEVIAWINENIGKKVAKTTKPQLRTLLEKLEAPLYVDATFQNTHKFLNVSIKMPASDNCLSLCPGHSCFIPTGEVLSDGIQLIAVPAHYRRTLTLEGGVQIYRNFYTTDPSFLRKTVVADLVFQIKTDLMSGKKTRLINFENIRDKKSCRADYFLKYESDTGQIPIPGSKKSIELKNSKLNSFKK